MAISKDQNGNPIVKDGDTFVYGRFHQPDERNRSRYRFIDGVWQFDGFEND